MLFGEKNTIAVIGEFGNGKILPLTLELLGEGRKLADRMGKSLSLLLMGNHMEEEADKLRHYKVDEIICLRHDKLSEKQKEYEKEALVRCLREKKPKAVLIGASSHGRVLAAELAFAMDTEVVTDASKLCHDAQSGRIIITRPASDGKMIADFIIDRDELSMITIRSGVMGKAEWKEEKNGHMIVVQADWLSEETKIECRNLSKKKEQEIHLDRANVIVSGGRGMKGKEGFELLHELAERLGGEVGSTRPCVDAGWTVPAQQVGQSGISVKPKLYMAFGISGAIQHMTGISADCMIAVNQNERAAIFPYCDYGVVGDAKKVIEKMIEKIDQGEEFL